MFGPFDFNGNGKLDAFDFMVLDSMEHEFGNLDDEDDEDEFDYDDDNDDDEDEEDEEW